MKRDTHGQTSTTRTPLARTVETASLKVRDPSVFLELVVRLAVYDAEQHRHANTARFLCLIAGDLLERGIPLPAPLSVFLARRMTAIGSGTDPRKALGITVRRGRRPKLNYDSATQEAIRRMIAGEQKSSVLASLADQYGVDESNMRKHFNREGMWLVDLYNGLKK